MTHGSNMKRCLLAAGLLLLGLAAAGAQGGSLRLDDLLEAVKTDPKLVAEIHDELKKSDLKVADVNCTGFRHGHGWPELTGMRAAPYECDIGKRTVFIQADRTYLDKRKRPLRDVKTAGNRKRADGFRETNFRWQWKPKE